VVKGFQIYPNNVLTPNGDGYNDTWKIKNIEFYPNNSIKIYNSNGQLVKSLGLPSEPNGYKGDWDGKVNGVKLPTGTYYYMIDLNDGSAIIKGFLTILN
jgi:gliding motility-associated-like protein